MKLLLVLSAALAAAPLLLVGEDSPSGPRPGDSVAPFEGRDPAGARVTLRGDGPAAKATVVAFSSAKCPVAAVQAPRLGELARAYGSRGVRFLLVNPNPAEKEAEIREFLAGAGIDFPVIVDAEQHLADLLGVSRTTEVFLLDGDFRLRYRGALDDQYSVGTRKPAPTRRYLVEAMDALLEGGAIELAETAAKGCLIGRVRARPAATVPVDWHRSVAPIVRKHCVECHREGEIGPFPLVTYDDAAGVSRMIGEVVRDGRMPPWHADPRHGSWSNARRLTDAERETLLAWVDAGAPEGAPATAPPEPVPPAPRWRIGEPDLVLRAPKQRVPAQGTIEYVYESVATGLTEDRWVEAAEVHAGNRTVVHHILVFVQYPKERRSEQPRIDGGLEGGYFASMVPGERPNEWPVGSGKLLPAGSSLLFQIHYTANGIAQEDVSGIGLRFAKSTPERKVVTRGINHRKLRIAPGDAEATFTTSWRPLRSIEILAFLPHMHYRGKSFRYELQTPDGATRTLLDVPRYDFAWQATYRAAEPIRVPAGSQIRCTAVYDNSASNPANPDPTATVRWGDQSWEEMLIGYIDYLED